MKGKLVVFALVTGLSSPAAAVNAASSRFGVMLPGCGCESTDGAQRVVPPHEAGAR